MAGSVPVFVIGAPFQRWQKLPWQVGTTLSEHIDICFYIRTS
jgi:hypothetical protein